MISFDVLTRMMAGPCIIKGRWPRWTAVKAQYILYILHGLCCCFGDTAEMSWRTDDKFFVSEFFMYVFTRGEQAHFGRENGQQGCEGRLERSQEQSLECLRGCHFPAGQCPGGSPRSRHSGRRTSSPAGQSHAALLGGPPSTPVSTEGSESMLAHNVIRILTVPWTL